MYQITKRAQESGSNPHLPWQNFCLWVGARADLVLLATLLGTWQRSPRVSGSDIMLLIDIESLCLLVNFSHLLLHIIVTVWSVDCPEGGSTTLMAYTVQDVTNFFDCFLMFAFYLHIRQRNFPLASILLLRSCRSSGEPTPIYWTSCASRFLGLWLYYDLHIQYLPRYTHHILCPSNQLVYFIPITQPCVSLIAFNATPVSHIPQRLQTHQPSRCQGVPWRSRCACIFSSDFLDYVLTTGLWTTFQ